MNKTTLLTAIFGFAFITAFAGISAAGYIIYTKQTGRIDLLTENLEKTHRQLKKTKTELKKLEQETAELAEKKEGLAEEVSMHKSRIVRVEQEKESLEGRTQGLKAQKEKLEAELVTTRESLEKKMRSQELKIAELAKNFQKQLAMDKAMLKAQEEKFNEQTMAAEVLIEALTKKNKSLISQANENRELLVRLIEEEDTYSGEKTAEDRKKGAEEQQDLRTKIEELNDMIKDNKEIIAKNERIIVNIAGEKEKISNKLSRREQQFKDEAFKLHYNLGLAYDKNRQFEEAAAEYEKALKINPYDADANYNIGVIYDEQLHEPKKAIFHYREYLRLAPEAKDTEQVVAWIKDAQRELKYTPRYID